MASPWFQYHQSLNMMFSDASLCFHFRYGVQSQNVGVTATHKTPSGYTVRLHTPPLWNLAFEVESIDRFQLCRSASPLAYRW